jgi:xanthosine utilization system XapX-like protein
VISTVAGESSMPRSSDEILDRTRTREVTGVFHSRKALDAAVQDLLVSGIDRADIDVSASLDQLQRRVNYLSIPPADLADMPTAARQPFFGSDDLLATEAVISSVIGCAVAVAMSFYLVTRDMAAPPAILLSVLCGIAVGAAAIRPVRRLLRRERARGLERLSEAHGLLIWVRVRSPETEAKSREILMRHGAKAVHIHEIELAKTPDDLPLHSLRPDPWLGDERLGQP